MKYIFLLFLILLSSCSGNKVSKNHGVLSLEDKTNKLVLNKSNKNDILNILGPPSTISTFDENTWIYIETKKTNQSIFKLGVKKLSKNNVLILKIDQRGLLSDKEILNLAKMNDLQFDKTTTTKEYKKDTYLYGVLSSLREKINSPVKKRRKK
tara:strand:+ start:83 stop:541 length:459 start_codon:yes stop_codon:yes gene_type:complete